MVEGTRRLQVVIGGRVQGVGFRFFAVEQAQRRDLTGWVRNLGENRVEVVAEGPAESLEEYLTALRAGPPLARVLQVTAQWQEATGEFGRFAARASSWSG